jgi:hypothetical protein
MGRVTWRFVYPSRELEDVQSSPTLFELGDLHLHSKTVTGDEHPEVPAVDDEAEVDTDRGVERGIAHVPSPSGAGR